MARLHLSMTADLTDFSAEALELANLFGDGSGLPKDLVDRVEALCSDEPGTPKLVRLQPRSALSEEGKALIVEVEPSEEFNAVLAELRALRAV